jgi:hypothetical protein
MLFVDKKLLISTALLYFYAGSKSSEANNPLICSARFRKAGVPLWTDSQRWPSFLTNNCVYSSTYIYHRKLKLTVLLEKLFCCYLDG